MIDRIGLKAKAKAGLAGKWNTLLLAAVIFMAAAALSGITRTEYVELYGKTVEVRSTTAFSALISVFVLPVLTVGMAKFFLKHNRYGNGEIRDLAGGFADYGYVIGSMLWRDLFIFLWSLLFVIPGIIKSIEYSMTEYVLADNPRIGCREAIKVSMALTYGCKGEIFSFFMSFIGWYILCGISCGIAGLYVIPYSHSSFAYLYDQLKQAAVSDGRIPADVFGEADNF